MTDAAEGTAEESSSDGLVDEVDLIEQQPLEERAASFARVHDRLQAALGGQRS